MRRNYVVALLLWAFLGFFGAHRFYCGRAGSGLLYLVTAGLLGIGWMADIFLLPFLVAEANDEAPETDLVVAHQVSGAAAVWHIVRGGGSGGV